ncbi:MAG TPA: 50S ribosomal protein L9 [Gemmatimonadales bacterium]|jgi:large subunit ribosomal protein L9
MIELILRQDVPSLGKAGQLVRVKPGYARNFLLPRGLAFEATDGNRKRIEAEAKARDAKMEGERSGATELAGRLAAITIRVTAKAGEDGRLFGSITSADIARELEAKGLSIDRRKIEMEHPVKQVGFHSIPIRLHHDVQGEIRLDVVAGE